MITKDWVHLRTEQTLWAWSIFYGNHRTNFDDIMPSVKRAVSYTLETVFNEYISYIYIDYKYIVLILATFCSHSTNVFTENIKTKLLSVKHLL